MSGRPGAGGGFGPTGRPGATDGPRPGGPGGGRPGGMMGMGMGLPAAKPKDFRGSFRRLLGTLRPEAPLIGGVILLAIVSVLFTVVGPKILGNAVNTIFDGALGKQLLRAGSPRTSSSPGCGPRATTSWRTCWPSLTLTNGIDFGALGGVVALLVGLYIVSSVFGWMQGYVMAGVTQRTVYRLRDDVDHKLGRLPLRYFDGHPRGDLLSRVTNDIDNIGQSLQQSLTQLITSLLTIVGVLILMLTISPLLALISILAVPASLVVTVLIIGRSQKLFVAQWASTGALNGHVEEMHTGHAIVKAFGRQRAGDRDLRRGEPAPVPGELPGPVHLRDHPAGDDLHLQPQLRRHRGHRRPAGRDGSDDARRRRRVHPVLPPVHVPDHADRQHRQRPAVGRRVGGAGLRAARRGRGDPRRCRARRRSTEPPAPSHSRTSPSGTSRTAR